jgi:ABC-type Fe3+/spermidine/putrescine transport system ATPase subunit
MKRSWFLLFIVFLEFDKLLVVAFNDGTEKKEVDATNDALETFELLNEGEQHIKLKEQYMDVTLLLGTTGSGKSTFMQWIAGDNNKLKSVEVGTDSSKFLIEDGNRRISSTTKSKTLFPELVIDNKTNSAFYDCPGFSDTRSTSHDIASTFFIKKLTDFASSIKVILVVGHSNVEKGVNKGNFLELVRHITSLMTDIEKFKDSIAIMMTKVDNVYRVINGRIIGYTTDESVITNVASFLEEFLESLEQNLEHSKTPEDKTFNSKAIELMNILLEKNDESYTRIGIFRRPDKSGPLSRIPLLQEGKKSVEKILYEKLKFTSNNRDDFGYTVSDRSRNGILALVEKINDKVWEDLSKIVEEIKSHYNKIIVEMLGKVNSFVLSSENILVKDTDATEFMLKLTTGCKIASNFLEAVKSSVDVKDLASNIEGNVNLLGVNSCAENVKNINSHVQILNFLQIVNEKKLPTRSWSTLIENIEAFFSALKIKLEENVNATMDKIESDFKIQVKNVAQKIKTIIQTKVETLEIEKIISELKLIHTVITETVEETKNLRTAEEITEKISENIIKSDMSTPATRENLKKMLKDGTYLRFLEIMNGQAVDTISIHTIDVFQDLALYVKDSENWSEFLSSLYSKLSQYEIQKDVKKYNVKTVEHWGVEGRSQGIQISRTTLKLFLEKIKVYNFKKFEYISTMVVDDEKLKALNQVLSSTLSNPIEKLCSNSDSLVIRGSHVKFSDFVDDNGKIIGPCKFLSVNIFALNTIFIDKDITKLEGKKQINIIAPKWEIIGPRRIELDGTSGSSHNILRAENGTDGKPGLPGGSAGNFFGVGAKFENSKLLTITANGGLGGPGQYGGNGNDGNDGSQGLKGEAIFKNEYTTGVPPFAYSYHKIHVARGKPGEIGKNGGNGGAGGLGGKKGIIEFLSINGSLAQPVKIALEGSVGTAGVGGSGGRGGSAGFDLWLDIQSHCNMGFCKYNEDTEKWTEFSIITQARSGLPGVKGTNIQGIEGSKSMAFENGAHIAYIYKNYLNENLTDRCQKTNLIQFRNQLKVKF